MNKFCNSILNNSFYHRHLRIVAAHRTPPIDPFQAHGQTVRELCHGSARDYFRPDKFSALTSFAKDTTSPSHHTSYYISSPPRTHEPCPEKTDSPECCLHHSAQPVPRRRSLLSSAHPNARSCRRRSSAQTPIPVRSTTPVYFPATRKSLSRALSSRVPAAQEIVFPSQLLQIDHSGLHRHKRVVPSYSRAALSRYNFRQ